MRGGGRGFSFRAAGSSAGRFRGLRARRLWLVACLVLWIVGLAWAMYPTICLAVDLHGPAALPRCPSAPPSNGERVLFREGDVSVIEDESGWRQMLVRGLVETELAQIEGGKTMSAEYIERAASMVQNLPPPRGRGTYKRVLMIGVGGGSLFALLRERCSDCGAMVGVDSSAAVLRARASFFSSQADRTGDSAEDWDRPQFVREDGAEFVRKSYSSVFDVTVVDAFDVRGAVPRELLGPAFLADVRRVLCLGGLLVVNVVAFPWVYAGGDVHTMARTMRSAGFRDVHVERVPDLSNQLVEANFLLTGVA
mmetsp:Transcript_28009/g.91577  ORF Transcript_28009/g.91577 Transcript_28009/m.91577 type:complete len:309 (+) Transcript_28009:147-1073(+)